MTSKHRKLQIDRLELDLRGIPPATAEAAARALGPALARSLRQADVEQRLGNTDRLDAGRIASGAGPDAAGLATRIAGRIARQLSGRRS